MNAAGMRFIAINSRLVGYFEVEGRLTSRQSESAFFSPSRQLGVRVVCQILGTSQCESRIQGHPYLGHDPTPGGIVNSLQGAGGPPKTLKAALRNRYWTSYRTVGLDRRF
jgi:hypothetical protein